MDFPWGPLHYVIQGRGEPLLVIHGERESQVNSTLLDRLASTFTVVAPALPGFPPSGVPPWMRSTTEMASVMNWFLRRLALGPVGALGFGFGGWVAAEMAVQRPEGLTALVLQSPLGIKPHPGQEIVDRFLFVEEDYIALGFSNGRTPRSALDEPDETTLRAWDAAREMTTRVAFKPYMFNPALPHLLAGMAIPSLVVWGEQDSLVPRSCAERYVETIDGAALTIVPGGHWLDLEAPDHLCDLVVDFMSRDHAGTPGNTIN